MTLNVSKCEMLNLGNIAVNSPFQSKDHVKYLGVLINKQRKLTDHFEMIKQRVRPLVNRVSLISTRRVHPARLIQLFFVIVKSSVDYGSVIFNTQRPTLVKPLEQFCRVMLKKILRLKSTTFNSVMEQLIGNQQVEWHRRWMITAFPSQLCAKKYEWRMLQAQRNFRMKTRKDIAWVHILIASIPKGKEMRCVECDLKTSTTHLIDHTPVHLRRIVQKVMKLRNKDYSLTELMKVPIESLKEVWKLYRKLFNSGKI